MTARRLKNYLDANRVEYVTITHLTAYTAQEVAATAHVPGREMAKTVIVKVDGELAMVVLPANEYVDLESLRDATAARDVELAHEAEFRNAFPECEIGAMPPFGNLYGMDVYVADDLTQDRYIAFNAGSHSDVIRMAYEDFDRLVHPRVVPVGSFF